MNDRLKIKQSEQINRKKRQNENQTKGTEVNDTLKIKQRKRINRREKQSEN